MVDDGVTDAATERRGRDGGFLLVLMLLITAVIGSLYLLIQDRNEEAVAQARREISATAKKVGTSAEKWRLRLHGAHHVRSA